MKAMCKKEWHATDVQLQQSEVGIAVVCLALALLHDIVLENARRLGIVTVEPIEDLLYVIRPLGREVVWCSHGGCRCAGLLWC
jgi:hypothetical protein